MKSRLMELRNTLGLNQSDFGEKVGLSKASISALESGLRNITDRHIMLLVSELNVSEHWLRTGEGNMFLQPDKFSFDEMAALYKLSDLEKAIMRGYMELDADVRKVIMEKVESIIGARATQMKDEESKIEAEVAAYRAELEAEKKETTLSASDEVNKKSS